MLWEQLMRSVTAEFEEATGSTDEDGLRCDDCGREVAGRVLSTAGVSPTSITCNRCSRPAYFARNGHAAGV